MAHLSSLSWALCPFQSPALSVRGGGAGGGTGVGVFLVRPCGCLPPAPAPLCPFPAVLQGPGGVGWAEQRGASRVCGALA